MRFASLVLLASAACAHAFVSPDQGGDPWVQARSQNFDLITDLPEDEAVRQVERLKQLHSAMVRAGPGTEPRRGRLTVFAPRDQRGMKEFPRGRSFAASLASSGDLAVLVSGGAILADDLTVRSEMASRV